MKVLAGVVGGLIAAILVSVLFGMVTTPEISVMSFFVCWIGSVFWVRKAETVGKAWRKLMLSCSGLSFMLPLAAMIFTGQHLSKISDAGAGGAEMAGAAIGGGLVSGVMGFAGFFLGVVFLIIGLLVGRDKQVVYVQQGAAPPSN